MAEKQDDINQLKLRLKEAEKNTIMAATYGKQLLDENHELHSKLEETIKEYSLKIEALEQEKHAVTLKCETKVQNERSLIHELEQLREEQASYCKSSLAEASHNSEKEIQKLNKMVSSSTEALESKEIENQQNIERVTLLAAQLREAQERIDMCNTSIHDQTTDEATAALQSQVMTMTCEKQELATQVSSLNAQVKAIKFKLAQAEKTIETLNKEVENLECQSTSYYNALEQHKEEILELKMEIDTLRLAETDPGKKGNSLFAEVEDQRQVMERQLLDYKSKYNILKKQCEIKTQQISKMKLQLANLLSLSSNQADAEYLCNLEESLASARTQLEALKKHSQDLELKQSDGVVQHVQPISEAETTEEQNMTTFFRNMYMESQKKAEELDQALQAAQFEKVTLSDRILQLQRKLRAAESARDVTNSKIIKLQVKFEELASKNGETLGNDSKGIKQITEKIPGFDSTSNWQKEKEKVDNEYRMPLKEKTVNSNALLESITQSIDDHSLVKDKEISKHDIQAPKVMKTEDDQENKPAFYSDIQKKKTKKSVRMIETVAVQECDGEVQEAQLKREDGDKISQPKKKVLKKMNAPVVKVPSGGQPNECNQQ